MTSNEPNDGKNSHKVLKGLASLAALGGAQAIPVELARSAAVKAGPASAEHIKHMFNSPMAAGATYMEIPTVSSPTSSRYNPLMAQYKSSLGGEGTGYVLSHRDVPTPALAHEIGHHHTFKKGGKANTGGLLASQTLSPFTTLASTIAAATENTPSWGAGILNLTAHSPILLNEALASYHGHTLLKSLSSKHPGIDAQSVKTLLPAFATYAAPALTPLAITAGRKLYRKFKSQKLPETAMPTKELTKTSRIFASTPDSYALSDAQVPFEVRRKSYENHLKRKAQEAPTPYSKSVPVGALSGAALGALASLATRSPMRGSIAAGSIGGALSGGLLSHLDARAIQRAKDIIEGGDPSAIDAELASKIHGVHAANQAVNFAERDLRHLQLLDALEKRSFDDGFYSELHSILRVN